MEFSMAVTIRSLSFLRIHYASEDEVEKIKTGW